MCKQAQEFKCNLFKEKIHVVPVLILSTSFSLLKNVSEGYARLFSEKFWFLLSTRNRLYQFTMCYIKLTFLNWSTWVAVIISFFLGFNDSSYHVLRRCHFLSRIGECRSSNDTYNSHEGFTVRVHFFLFNRQKRLI